MNVLVNEVVIEPQIKVLVDVPNVKNGGLQGIDPRYRVLKWSALAEHIRTVSIPAVTLRQVMAFMPLYGVQQTVVQNFNQAFAAIGQAGFTLLTKYGKDVDSDITREIFLGVLEHQQRSIIDGVLWLPLQVQHVLVSGDGDFARTYAMLKRAYGDDLELDLIVYAWRDSLHGAYTQLAQRGLNVTIHYLDDIPNFSRFHTI